jgi:2'-5' RNA ligase
MYYILNFYPPLSAEASRAIEAIRLDYDPTSAFTRAHITVLCPVPERVGEERLICHIEQVLSGRGPFDIRLGGFHRSRDHWLFLTLREGESRFRKIYRALYTDMLAEFARDDAEFIPHLGLGLPSAITVDRLHLTGIPDGILERATGKRQGLPEDASLVLIREFRLSQRDA